MNNISIYFKKALKILQNVLVCLHLSNKKSAKSAKERLQIVVSHQRATDTSPEFVSELRKELLAVICKYTTIDADKINVNLQKVGNCSILELNVAIPELLAGKANNTKVKLEPTIKGKTKFRKKEAVTCFD